MLLQETALDSVNEPLAEDAQGDFSPEHLDPKAAKILLLSNKPVNLPLVSALRTEGFDVSSIESRTAPEPVRLARATLAFIMLESATAAADWLRTLRAWQVKIPLVVAIKTLTGFDEVILLELGADQVMALDDEPRVTIARLRAALRRTLKSAATQQGSLLTFGRLTINARTRNVQLGEKPIRVTSGEFDLLWLLASRAGETVSRDELQMRLRGFIGEQSHRFVDARFYRMRHRFGSSPEVNARIRTVRSTGFLFTDVAW